MSFGDKKLRVSDDYVGDLVVETTDPDGPYLFLRLNKDVPYVLSKDYIILKVEKDSFTDSQK